MNSTRYRDAILNSSAIWKYVILLSLEQGVLISLEYDSLIYPPHTSIRFVRLNRVNLKGI